MNDNLMEKVNALGERLKISGSEVSQKISAGVSSMSFKMKEFFQGPNQADILVEEATAETLEEPDWASNLEICDMINQGRINIVDVLRGIKKRIIWKSSRIQYFSLVLLETVVKNCEKGFSEVAAERILDDIVKLIDDPQTVVNNRNKALMLIEAWGESSGELRYLPVFEETYKSLKSRGIRFPGRDEESLAPIITPARSGSRSRTIQILEPNPTTIGQLHNDIHVQSFTSEQRKEAFNVARNSVELLSTVLSSSPQEDALQDELTTTLVQQCHETQYIVLRIIETAGDDEALLFEALNVNDELQKALSKYEDMRRKQPSVTQQEPQSAILPVVAVEPVDSLRVVKEDDLVTKPADSRGGAHVENNDDMMDDLDEMIFGKNDGKKKESSSSKEDLISF